MGCTQSNVNPYMALKKSPLATIMNDVELMQFASLWNHVVIKSPSHVFKIGDPSEYMYLVYAGNVAVTVIENGQETTTNRKEGEFFGEEALNLTSVSSRASSVTTLGEHPVVLITIDRAAFSLFVNDVRTNPATKDNLLMLIGRQMTESLRRVPFLSEADDKTLSKMASLFSYEVYNQGSNVFEEGSIGDKMYIVVKGSVSVWGRDAETNENLQLSNTDIKAGGYFGEIALMMNMPRTATIVATTNVVLLTVSKGPFMKFLEMFPPVRMQFDEVCKLRITQLFQKYSIPFFKAIPPKRFHELGYCCKLEELRAQEVLFHEGDIGTKFYLVVHGKLQVLKGLQGGSKEEPVDVSLRRYKEVATVLPGQYFGEVALVTEKPRGATLKAVDRTILLSITGETFHTFFDGDRQAVAEFAIKLSRESVNLAHVLYHKLGLEHFTKHVQSEYSTENLYFWQAVNEFEENNKDVKPSEELLEKAKALAKRFLGSEALEQVNVNAELYNEVLTNLSATKVASTIFNACRNEVLNLMSTDSFKRFKATASWTSLLQEVGSYSELSDKEAELQGKINEESGKNKSSNADHYIDSSYGVPGYDQSMQRDSESSPTLRKKSFFSFGRKSIVGASQKNFLKETEGRGSESGSERLSESSKKAFFGERSSLSSMKLAVARANAMSHEDDEEKKRK